MVNKLIFLFCLTLSTISVAESSQWDYMGQRLDYLVDPMGYRIKMATNPMSVNPEVKREIEKEDQKSKRKHCDPDTCCN